jgi:hypothetical protein
MHAWLWQDSEDDKAASANLQRMLGNITNAFTRKKDIDSLGKALMAADYAGEGGNLDGMVDIEELREVLKDHPNALHILNVSAPFHHVNLVPSLFSRLRGTFCVVALITRMFFK